MSGLRVLVVEDDRAVREAVVAVLDQRGYEVAFAAEGRQAVDTAQSFRPDVAILDITLPGDCDGFQVARRIKSNADIPLIFLTASEDLGDTLTAFGIGADDYVKKPFSVAELMARVDAVLRRSGRALRTIRIRDVLIDEDAGRAWRGGHDLRLTSTELRLLATLARQPGRAMSKVQLLAEVWGWDTYSPNVVEVHISSLRRKLEESGPRLLFTERGTGYVIRP